MSTLITVTIELKGKTTIEDEHVPQFCGFIHKLIESYGIQSSDIYELRLRSETYSVYSPYKFNGKTHEDVLREIAGKRKGQKGDSDE